MQCLNSQIWNPWRPSRNASVPNQLQEPSSLQCAHSFEVREEVGFLPEFPPLVSRPICFGSTAVTGELRCIPGGRRLIGVILLVKARDESVTSVGIVALLDATALLDELPPRTNVDVCVRSGSAGLPRIPKSLMVASSRPGLLSLGASDGFTPPEATTPGASLRRAASAGSVARWGSRKFCGPEAWSTTAPAPLLVPPAAGETRCGPPIDCDC